MTLFKLLFVLYLSNLLKVSRLYLEQLLMTSLADELQSHLLVDAKMLLQALDQPVLRNGRSLGFLENLVDYTLQPYYFADFIDSFFLPVRQTIKNLLHIPGKNG